MKTPTHEAVALGAHQLWQDSGCADGRDIDNWLQAEHHLSTQINAAVVDPRPAAPDPLSVLASESPAAQTQVEVTAEQRQAARLPVTAHKAAPKAAPAETGKPLWRQPHSR